MKNSDSKNSLAELNPDEPICFVCLEEASADAALVPSSLLRSCTCKFYTHPDCWNTWQKGKSDYDCPYCSKRTMHLSIPMTAPFQQDYTQQIRSLESQEFCNWKKMLLFFLFAIIIIAFTLPFFFS
jgi:hypothetical protein